MLDDLPCPWLRLDAHGAIGDCNAALARLTGRPDDRLRGQPFDTLLTGAARVLFQSYLQPLLQLHGNVEEFSLTLAGPEPAAAGIDVLVYASRHGPADAPGALVDLLLAPIRRRRQIEDELLRVKRAADHAPGLIFQLIQMPDGTRLFPYTSEAIRRLYGVTSYEARESAEAVLRYVDPQDRAAMSRQMRTAAEQGLEWRSQFRVHLADGRHGWHEVQATSRRLADGVVLWHGHVADVTQRREMEAAVADRQAMERLHQARNEFLARVSHELRTPLNGILGFAQLLATDGAANLTAPQRDRLEVISASGRHLLQLINEVLEVTSIESGQVTVPLQALELGPLVARALRVVEPPARQAGVRLLPVQVPAGLQVLANEQRLHQVLVNLLSNAVKYNRRDGSVTVGAAGRGGTVKLVVTDTGRGLTPAQLDGLFQPFNRLGAEQGDTEGSGLGLVICKHLAALMGGRIEVVSRPGEGSAFTLTLQQAEPAARPPATTTAAPPAPRGNLPAVRGRVLYAEDNEVNAILMRAIVGLRPEVELVVAPDPTAALQSALEVPPDLLLLDMHLPGMNGIELLAALRTHERLRDVPAVAVSAAARSEDIALARARGFGDYWTKPLDIDATLAALDRLLART